MNELISKSDLIIASVHYLNRRTLQGVLNTGWQMNGIYGARGVGKTTLLLQMLQDLKKSGKEVLFVRLDDFYFTEKNCSIWLMSGESKGVNICLLMKSINIPAGQEN